MSGPDLTGLTHRQDGRPGLRVTVELSDEEARTLEDAADEYANYIETWDEVCEEGEDRSPDQIRAHRLVATAGDQLAAARKAARPATDIEARAQALIDFQESRGMEEDTSTMLENDEHAVELGLELAQLVLTSRGAT